MTTETKETKVSTEATETKKAVEKTGKFAVIATGGKQYVVRVGDVLKIEKVDIKEIKTEKITFDEVLLVDDGKTTKVGTPVIAGAKVVADVLNDDEKQTKVTIIKFKSKSNYKKKNGHRQRKTIVRVSEIK